MFELNWSDCYLLIKDSPFRLTLRAHMERHGEVSPLGPFVGCLGFLFFN